MLKVKLSLLAQANQSFRKGDYESALRLYKESVEENPALDGLLSINVSLTENKIQYDTGFSNNKSKKIIVYTCNFGNYESVKEPIFYDSNAEYILFTDNENITCKYWKIIVIKEVLKDPRRLSRLPKILPHKYLPEHDYSVYIDSSMEIKAKNIHDLVSKCLRGSDLALYRHSERNCVYKEIDFCKKSKYRNVDAYICDNTVDSYKKLNYPANNGLFENGFIVRANNNKTKLLNEQWWKEYLNSSERDQFTFMLALYKQNMMPNTIKVGKQMRKNPFVNWKAHSYQSKAIQLFDCDVYFVYMDKFYNWGTTRLRGEQVVKQLVEKGMKVKLIPYSQAATMFNKHMIMLKVKDYGLLRPLLGNSNKLYLDMVDCNSQLIKGNESVIKECELGIFTTNSAKENYKHLFKKPDDSKVIYHHWDSTLDEFQPETHDLPKIGYFGVKPKGHLFGQIPDVDFYEVTSVNFDDTMKKCMAGYNVQYIIRPPSEQSEFPATTKISTSSVFAAPVIATRTNEVEILGEEYPYYSDSYELADIEKVINKVKETYGKEEWHKAVDIMLGVKAKTSLSAVVQEYETLINSFTKLESFYSKNKTAKKAIYTANIGGYDKPFSLDEKLAEGWDAFYFTDNEDVVVEGWTKVLIKPEKNRENVTLAREIKTSPHKFLPDYEVTLWVDSNFKVAKSLNSFIENLPDKDFITTKHPKRRCVYEEAEQPRVVLKTGRKKIAEVKEFLEKRSFPKNYGLQETNFVLRKNNVTTQEIGNKWWLSMKLSDTYRDQLWLSYSLFSLGKEVTLVNRYLRDWFFDIKPHFSFVDLKRRSAFFSSKNKALICYKDSECLDLSKDITIQLWCKFKEWPEEWNVISSKMYRDHDVEYCLRVKNKKTMQFIFSKEGRLEYIDIVPQKYIKLDEWANLAITRSENSVVFYINGVQAAEKNVGHASLVARNRAPVKLFSDKNKDFEILICDFAVFKYVLNPADIIHLYTNGVKGNGSVKSELYDDFIRPWSGGEKNQPLLSNVDILDI